MPLSKTLVHKCFSFETLENRALLAGNVVTSFSGGLLTLTGDAAANNVQLTQLASGAWQMKGIGTKIDGANAAETFTGVTDITTDLAAGNDILKVFNGTSSGDLTVQFSGGGNKAIQLSNIHAADISVTTGAGNDSITVNKCTADSELEVEAHNGTNTVVVTNSHGGNQLVVEGVRADRFFNSNRIVRRNRSRRRRFFPHRCHYRDELPIFRRHGLRC